MRELERMGLEPDIDHYEVVYTAPLLPYKDQNTMLEELYAKFNVSRPDDFTGHSLSVSDIVALRQNGAVSCHYVDSIGTRIGLIAELQKMQKSLTGRDRNLRRWTASLLAKLAEMTDAEYEALDLYPDE